MNNQPCQIEAELHKQADEQLRRELEKSLDDFLRIAREGPSDLYKIEMLRQPGNDKLNGYGVLTALKDHVFHNLQERRRSQAVDAFMEKVESLASEIEALRITVNQ